MTARKSRRTADKSSDSVDGGPRRQKALATYLSRMYAFLVSKLAVGSGFFWDTRSRSCSQRALASVLPQSLKNANTLGSHARTSNVALRTWLTWTPN